VAAVGLEKVAALGDGEGPFVVVISREAREDDANKTAGYMRGHNILYRSIIACQMIMLPKKWNRTGVE